MKKATLNLAIVPAMVIALLASCSPNQEAEKEAPVSGLNLANIDSTVNPADDFFLFVNGNWIANTEIPGDQGRWGSFNELREDNNEVVLKVLENAVKSGKYPAGSDQLKAADFYASGMDSALSDLTGLMPLNAMFDKIAAIKNVQDLQAYLAEDQTYGGGSFFGFAIFPDLKESSVNAAYLAQDGLGLPEVDYYTKKDDRSVEIREKYVEHISRVFQMKGMEETEAQKVLELETRLANSSMTIEERRNIPALYNKMSIEGVSQLSPSMDWSKYFLDMGMSTVPDTIIVMQPDFLQEFERVVNGVPVSDWQSYLTWHLLKGASPFLNDDYQSANFDFYSKELRGLKQMKPRWKRVLQTTSGFMGEAIGKLYVDETFPPEAKEKAKEMVENIKGAYKIRINNLDWMTDSTKENAVKKVNTMRVKIGYPDKWKDYAELSVEVGPEKGSYLQNVMNAAKFDFQKDLEKYGKPVDREEWGMSPQTVNAYYNPLNNEIVFPAAILQPPFYNYKADEAVNYGGIGAVIGHEISHGFDDQGSRFDAEGNMENWWLEEDSKNFQEKTARLVNQFDAFEPIEGVTVNGKLTLGENIGDLGGAQAAYDGLQLFYEKNGKPGPMDGFTPEQRFFISWGTIWRIKFRDETLRTQVTTDPHSPGMYRTNGPLSNMEDFYSAFNVKENNGMWRADSVRVKIW
ncbi:MAG: M13 family metallopeptidase [Flammeovirgaceae bacterium]|nr:M13 family metallopeptidase [Flammeovirgaceae bacterium]